MVPIRWKLPVKVALASAIVVASLSTLPPAASAAESSHPVCDATGRLLREPPQPTDGPPEDGSAAALASGPGRLGVYVEHSLFPGVQASVDRYMADLRLEGWDPYVVSFQGGATQLRSALRDEYPKGLVGALFVGDLPVYEFTSGDPTALETYPHDLYFMDLDGTYQDRLPSDVHVDGTGDVEPEIFVSRVTASALAGLAGGRTEAQIINDWFTRVRDYRRGATTYDDSGAVFADADWADTTWAETMRHLHPTVKDVHQPAASTPQAFRALLGENHESWLQAVHSWPARLAFYRLPRYGGPEGELTAQQFLASNPRPGFYNLFSCSAARFTSPNFLLGAAVLGTSRGLQGIGSTKTGGIAQRENDLYYRALGRGQPVGLALLEWFQTHTGSTGVPTEAAVIAWLNGIVMQGDPTLIPATMGDGPAAVSGTAYEDLDGDGERDPGEPGLAGRSVFVDRDGDRTRDPWEPVTVTGSNGNYVLRDLPPGAFDIAQVLPSGWVQTTAPPRTVSLVSGMTVDGVDFGSLGRPGPPVGVVASAAGGSVTVRWSEPDGQRGAAVTAYDVRLEPGGLEQTVSSRQAVFTGLSKGTKYTASVRARNAAGAGPFVVATPVTLAPSARRGYAMVRRDGVVHAFGDAVVLGHASSSHEVAKIVTNASGTGYWVLDEGGRVHAFGVPHHGDVADTSKVGWFPDEHPTTMSLTADEQGYWIFTNRGRALAFGSAAHHGDLVSLGVASALNGPVVDSVGTPDGLGYYMVASDGGVFAFGTARFEGSMGGVALNEPVNALVPDPDQRGYWLIASDGGVFAFDADFVGSVPAALSAGTRLNAPVIGGLAYGAGYLMVASDGGIFSFSDLPFLGSLGGNPPPSPVASVAAFAV